MAPIPGLPDSASAALPEHVVDFVVIGSGGGLCGAIAARRNGAKVLVVEKQEYVGGSTGLSGGVIWLPNNPLMEREGVADSFEEGMAYFAAVVGDVGPASSRARREQYITAGHSMIEFLERAGIPFRRCEGYADYYSEAAGGKSRSRSVEVDWFDGKALGPWFGRLRQGYRGVAMYCREGSELSLARRSARSALVALRVGMRTAAGRATGQARLTMGAGLIARLLAVALRHGVEIWTGTAFADFILAENGRVAGVVVRRDGRPGQERRAAQRRRVRPERSDARFARRGPAEPGHLDLVQPGRHR